MFGLNCNSYSCLSFLLEKVYCTNMFGDAYLLLLVFDWAVVAGALGGRRVKFLLHPVFTCKWKLMSSLCEMVGKPHVVITGKELFRAEK